MVQPVGSPHSVSFPDVGMWRVARSGEVDLFSSIDPLDVTRATGGNRFDVAGGGVLYGATTGRGCYAETLAPFRPSPAVISAIGAFDGGFMVCGGVSQDWRHTRVRVRMRLPTALPFLDVEHPGTMTYLDSVLASELVNYGVTRPLDVADVRGKSRLVTRAIATWAYSQIDEDGLYLYSGIRFTSRHNDEECWAVFEGTELEILSTDTITLADPDLRTVADEYGLRLF